MEYKNIEKIDLAILPTPIQRLKNISKAYGANIYIKRDDLTGLGMGGNKLRKLEYLLKEALDLGCSAVLTHGATQTNHGMLTAAAASKLGLKTILILKDSSGKRPELSGNLMLDEILGADVRLVNTQGLDKEEAENLASQAAKEAVLEYEARGMKVYEIPTGGSSALGSLGYVRAAGEIKDQAEAMDLKFDYLICGQGSKGTFSGLWLGSKYYQTDYELIGVNVMETPATIKEDLASFINEVSSSYEMNISCRPDDLKLVEDAFKEGYAVPDRETFQTIRDLARSEGIFVDPTYTGKVFVAMLDLIRTGEIEKGSNILFVHTGGYPGFFTDYHTDFVKAHKDIF